MKVNISSPFNSPPLIGDRVYRAALRISGTLSGAVAVLIFLFLLKESLPTLKTLGLFRFLTDAGWHPTENEFNLLPMLAGSVTVTAGAVLLATPAGILSALFCRFYAPAPVASFYRRIVELLSGIPSVVYGFWGLVVLVPLINMIRPPGASLLAGILILALMILPLVALIAENHFASVSPDLLQGAAALGLSKWRTIFFIVFPSSRNGLITSVLLETGRALGETMAVLMVCGNIAKFPGSVFDPVRTLTANIALEMAYALDTHRAVLFVSGLVLLFLVGGLILLSDFLTRRNPS